MQLPLALAVYAIVVIVLIVLLVRHGYNAAPATIIALIVGMFLLLIICPPSDVDPEVESTSMYALYIVIELGTVIAVMIYALVTAIRSRSHTA